MKFNNKIKGTALSNIFRESIDYYSFIIGDFIYSNGSSSIDEISSFLMDKNLNHKIEISSDKFRNLTIRNEICNLTDVAKKIHDKYYRFRNDTRIYNEFELYKKFLEIKDTFVIPYDYQLVYDFLVYQYSPESEDDYHFIYFIMHFLFIKQTSLFRKIDNIIQDFDQEDLDEKVISLVDDESAIDFLSLLKIVHIKDLKLMSPFVLALLINIQIFTFSKKVNKFEKLEKNAADIFETIPNIVKNWNTVTSYNNYYMSKSKTYEEIAKKQNVTRERIRQIVNHGKSKYKMLTNKKFFLIDAYLKEKIGLKGFIHIDNLNHGSHFVNGLVYFVKSYENYMFKYDDELRIIYNILTTTVKNLEQKHINNLGFFYSSTKQLSQPSLKDKDELLLLKSIINKNYRTVDNIIVLRGYGTKDVILRVIDDHFTDGYRASGNEHYERLLDILKNTYQLDIDGMYPRKVKTLFVNHNYALIGKSTYINPKKLPKLNREFVKRIQKFILENGPAVYYITIFENFKFEFQSYDIGNYYHVKGVVDHEFDGEFITKRDYITTEKGHTPSLAIRDLVLDNSDEVNLETIKAQFKGVKDYVINQIMDSDDDIVKLSNNRFVARSNVKIEDFYLEKIKDYIESIMDEIDFDTISSTKLYARMKLNNENLLEEISFINKDIDLYYILKQCYPMDYHYENNYISRTSDNNNYYEIVFKYFKDYKEFSKNDVDEFFVKMNLRPVANYLDFIHRAKDDFVQFDMGSLANKDYIEISNDILEKITWNLNQFLEKRESIVLSKLKNYFTFPAIQYSWNQYLLAGIIRSYLSNLFIIENTSNSYNKTSFIIKRGKKIWKR